MSEHGSGQIPDARLIVQGLIQNAMASCYNEDDTLRLRVDGGSLFNILLPAKDFMDKQLSSADDRRGYEATMLFVRSALANARNRNNKEEEQAILDLIGKL